MNIKVKEGKQEEDVFVLCRLDSGTVEYPKEGKWNHHEDQATAVSGGNPFRSPWLYLKCKFHFVPFSAWGKGVQG